MAVVVHKYEPSPLSVEKAAGLDVIRPADPEETVTKKAEAERRAEEAKRKELARQTERRSANRGQAGLRKERAKFERARRLEKEMELAERRGQLILKSTVERQAGFIFVSLRQAILNFPSRYARTVVGITDPRQAKEALTRAAHEFLNELSGFAERMTDNPDSIGDENGAPFSEDAEGQA